MKKKLLAFLLTAAMLLSLLPAAVLADDLSDNGSAAAEASAAASGNCGENLTWTLSDSGTLTISGTGAMYDITDNQNTLGVEIHDDIINLVIEAGVTTIGAGMFMQCAKLTSVTIPKSVTEIGRGAFEECSALTETNIPDSVTSIGGWAFEYCTGLTTVVLPASGIIDDGAFFGCSSLTSITIPAGITDLGEEVFTYCSSLDSIQVARDNPYYSSKGGVLYNKAGTELLCCPGGMQTEYTIPEGIAAIGSYAFMSCSKLPAVTIPDSVTSIGDWAFCECSSLTEVTIPDSVVTIGQFAFRGCSSLAGMTIPTGVQTIGTYAFGECTALTSVEVSTENACFSSQDGILYNKAGTELLCCPAGVQGAVVVPDSTEKIGDFAFNDCTGMTSISLPLSIATIGDFAFSGCSGLTDVYYAGSSLQWVAIQIIQTDDANAPLLDAALHLTSTAAGTCGENLTWELDSSWTLTISGTGAMTDFANPLIVDQDEEPGWAPFRANIRKVVIDSGVTSIGISAFEDCIALTGVTIPDSVADIRMDAFNGCGSLKNVTIPASVKDIARSAFESCSSLETIVIPDGMTYIANDAFEGCCALTSVTIPESVATIGSDAFYGCNSLRTIAIPDSVTAIGYGAFQNCLSLESVTIPDGITQISEHTFCGCTALTDVTIPASVTEIGPCAFALCSSLKNVWFEGTRAQWNAIAVSDAVMETEQGTLDNTALSKATIHYGPAASSPFEDVQNSSDYYYTPVLWALENEITNGVDATHFAPNSTCTRGQVVTFLYRLAGEPEVTGELPFKDVKENDYFYSAVLWGYQNEIVKGISPSTFQPNATVTRAQFMTFLWRYAGEPAADGTGSTFEDVPAGQYYTDAVLWGHQTGIVQGKSSTSFDPFAGCRRAETVTFLYRYLGKK